MTIIKFLSTIPISKYFFLKSRFQNKSSFHKNIFFCTSVPYEFDIISFLFYNQQKFNANVHIIKYQNRGYKCSQNLKNEKNKKIYKW